jgi:hypothetical protein
MTQPIRIDDVVIVEGEWGRVEEITLTYVVIHFWDHRFWNLQVTDATDRAIQLRVLATAADASKAWNLRCDIREKLIALIQQRYPQSLPRLRADLVAAHPQ